MAAEERKVLLLALAKSDVALGLAVAGARLGWGWGCGRLGRGGRGYGGGRRGLDAGCAVEGRDGSVEAERSAAMVAFWPLRDGRRDGGVGEACRFLRELRNGLVSQRW